MVLLKEVFPDADARLVESCRRGDPAAFEELVRRYKDRVYNVVYRFLGNHEDAQDVTQEVFLKAYQSVGNFRGHAHIFTWLYSIAANLARNKLRDGKRKGRNRGRSLEAMQEAHGDSAEADSLMRLATVATPETAARAAEAHQLLQQCLTELPEHYRLAFVMRTIDRLSYEEIAEALGCPAGTVKSRLNQARMLLHQRLRELSVL